MSTREADKQADRVLEIEATYQGEDAVVIAATRDAWIGSTDAVDLDDAR